MNKQEPTLGDELISAVLTMEELVSATQLFGFSKDLFAQMAVNSANEGNEQMSQVYAARAQLSLTLYAKFKTLASIGEPDSRQVH